MPGVADDARLFICGDERAAGFGGVVGEDEVVDGLKLGFHFFEFGAEAEGEGFALGDAGLGFGDDDFVFADFSIEQAGKGAGDAVVGATGGGGGDCELVDFAGFLDKGHVAQAAPLGEGEFASGGVGLVFLVAEVLDEEAANLVGEVFDIGLFAVFVQGCAGDVHTVRLAVGFEGGDGGVERGDFGGEDGGVDVEPDGFSFREVQEVARGFEGGEPIGEFVFHRDVAFCGGEGGILSRDGEPKSAIRDRLKVGKEHLQLCKPRSGRIQATIERSQGAILREGSFV